MTADVEAIVKGKCRSCWGVGKRSRKVAISPGRTAIEHIVCRVCGGSGIRKALESHDGN